MLPREVSNRMMLLLLLNHLGICKNGILRLQSIVFQIERDIRKIGWTSRTFNYKFIRWHYGAYSKELSEDIAMLKRVELIEVESNSIKLTAKAQEYLLRTKDIVRKLYFLNEESFYGSATILNEMELASLLLKVYEDNGVIDYKMGKILEDVKYANL